MATGDEPVGPRDHRPLRLGRGVDPIPVWLWAAAMRVDMQRIVRTVMQRVVPQLAGLASGDELDTLVKRYAFRAYLSALDDPDLKDSHPSEWRTSVAGRVGLALAFPQTAPCAQITNPPRLTGRTP
jgi:hypothetical protein